MLKSDELKAKLNDIKAKAEALTDATEIKNAIAEIKNLKAQIELAEMTEADEARNIEDKLKDNEVKNMDKNNVVDKTKENANAIRAMIKKTLGSPLTVAENALLVGGDSGEGYILPQEISTTINKLVRQYKSIANLLGYMPVTALTGSFPTEDFETVSELVDFADGTPIGDISDIKFKNVPFSLKEKAGFISLSNTLLSMTDNDLINYVSEVFARKYVITQNKMGIATLKANKTVKTIADWKALKKSINKDLTEAVKGVNMVIVTNQDGFDTLDEALDNQGRPVLQPNPTNPTQKLFMGYPVEVFDNTLMPTVATKAPIFYGDLKDAVKFVSNGQYAFATDKSVGFLSNVTVARIITHMDCVQADSSDKAYCYGEFTIA